ncbi:MAG: GNAT family N-acetyltransferase [Burkholderiales bacterium]|nr:GNAT family N-acetyltransferase [Phycisphaerae bacterium]
MVLSEPMCGLSNFFRWRDAGNGSPACLVRLVEQPEVDDALRLLLGSGGHRGDDHAARDFVRFAHHRNLDLGSMHVAVSGNKLLASSLAILSPGKTALLMTSTAGTVTAIADAIAGCVQATCDGFNRTQTHLAQLLLEPAEVTTAAAMRRVGFADLATLIYLQRPVIRTFVMPTLPNNTELVTYSEMTHHLFGRAILASYDESLDCPPLHGRREVDDILAGHKSAGEFSPDLWFCLVRDGAPLGVLLLSPSRSHGTMELVYVGLSVAARGQRIGDYFLALALHHAHAQSLGHLTLAVDAANVPALRLYHRHGLAEVHRRDAMLMELA